MTDNFRLILADIIRGYTQVTKSEFGPFFIKHLNNFDIAEIDFVYSNRLEDAKKRGVPTVEEKTKYLLDNEILDRKEEEKINDYSKLIVTYDSNRSNVFLKSERDKWTREIKKLEADIKKLSLKKNNLIGDTAESFASKKANEQHILLSFYSDKGCQNPLFSKDEFNEFDDKTVNRIIGLFKINNEKFSPTNIKKVAISPSFLNLFFYSPDDIYAFYGRPIVELSFYQLDAWGNAKKFQNDLQEFPNIPKDIQQDPDKLFEYVELNKNYKKAFPDSKDDQGGGGSIVGAKKSDLEILGIQSDNAFSFDEELKKSGGKLTKEQLMKLQGDL